MAKKKETPTNAPVAEETEAVIEETEEAKAEPVMSDTDKFIYTQLRIINSMNNPAKAKRLAERVLRNRKGK